MSALPEEAKSVLLVQKELGEDIERTYVNWRKTGVDKRTQAKITAVSRSVEELWKHFVENNEKLIALDVERQSDYFRKNYFDVVCAIYEKLLDSLKEAFGKFEKELETGNRSHREGFKSEENLEKITSCCSDREAYLKMLESALSRYSSIDSNPEVDVDELEFVLGRIEKYFEQFSQSNYQLLSLDPSKKEKLTSEFGKIVDSYQSLVVLIELRICSLKKEKVNNGESSENWGDNNTNAEQVGIRTHSEACSKLRLPRIELPKFRGETSKWPEFRDLFVTLIHERASISNIEKMHYLKMHLEGPAADVIKHLQLSNVNYTTAWDLLNNRYNNKKLLISNNLKSLFSLRYVNQERAEELKSLLDTVKENIYALKNYGEAIEHWNSILVFLVSRRLPPETFSLWEQKFAHLNHFPEFRELEIFLENRFKTIEEIERKSAGKLRVNQNFYYSKNQVKSFVVSEKKRVTCVVCGHQHSIFLCPKYNRMEPQERLALVQKQNLCGICLRSHPGKQCKSKTTCYKCDGQHNTSLHVGNKLVTSINGDREVLLATAIITVQASNNTTAKYKALIDQGSMTSIISEKVAQDLRLPRERDTTTVTGISGRSQKSRGRAEITFWSRCNKPHQQKFQASAIILPKLVTCFPKVSRKVIEEYEKMDLADPQFFASSKIDIILGADVHKDILLGDMTKGSLLAQNTCLGWMLSGGLTESTANKQCLTVTLNDKDNETNNLLKKVWETEERLDVEPNRSEEEIFCEKFYADTTFKSGGRYVCRLPFKANCSIGRSKHVAVSNFLQLEKRFRKNESFKNNYVNVMREYIELGHAVPAIRNELSFKGKDGTFNCFYLPHLAVIRESSSTTKTRIVFNASAKSSNGKSLNDNLMTGPILQPDVVSKVIRFRMRRFVFVCDVQKMYRQIKINAKDWNYQRFVFRENETDNLMEFCLTTVTFGEASAPFTAIRILQQVAHDNKTQAPIAARILMEESYVDDIHFGADGIEDIKEGNSGNGVVMKEPS